MAGKLRRLAVILKPVEYTEGKTWFSIRENNFPIWKNSLLRGVFSVSYPYTWNSARLRLRMNVPEEVLTLFTNNVTINREEGFYIKVHPTPNLADINLARHIVKFSPDNDGFYDLHSYSKGGTYERINLINIFRPYYHQEINFNPLSDELGYIPSAAAHFYVLALQMATSRVHNRSSFTVMKDKESNIISYMKDF
jgi:hypothetical protein